jgi:predicted dienelactone hydrolase
MQTNVLGRRLSSLAAIVVAAAIGLVAAAPAIARPPLAGELRLAAPTGPKQIGTVALHLVDPARTDPWLPTHPLREVMAQVWYPADKVRDYPAAAWLSAGAVPHFEQGLGLPAGLLHWPTTHAHAGAPVDQVKGGRPVVLFSAGFGLDRAMGTTIVEDLASHGYVVVAIDHTHDAGEVEFPGGRVETYAIPGEADDAVIGQALAVREADSRFVLDQLTAINAGRNPDAGKRPLPTGLRGAFDLSRTGMFGHSLGGATAAATMHDDPRVMAGINLDGTLFGASATAGSDRPFLLLSSDIQAGQPEDPSWDEFWANQRGWKHELRLTGTTHNSFTDFEVLYPQAAPVVGLTPVQVTQAIGTLEPVRAIRAQRAYIRAFFDLHLRHLDSHLFTGPSRRYPEMLFVR